MKKSISNFGMIYSCLWSAQRFLNFVFRGTGYISLSPTCASRASHRSSTSRAKKKRIGNQFAAPIARELFYVIVLAYSDAIMPVQIQ